MTVLPLPDIEAAAVAALKAAAAALGIPAARIAATLPADPPLPYLVVRLAAPIATATPERITAGVIQCDAYAATKSAASALIRATRAALANANGATHAAAVLSTSTGPSPRWAPADEYTPARPRYSLDVIVHAHTP